MQILKDFNKLYDITRPLAIGYMIGWCIGGSITMILFLAILIGWRPFKSVEDHSVKPVVPYMCPGMEIYKK
jgi:hypothetical protein